MSTGPDARSRSCSVSARSTSTSKPTRTPPSLPLTRTCEPAFKAVASERSEVGSSISKATGAQRATASGSMSAARTASGAASVRADAVQVVSLMARMIRPDPWAVISR